MSERTPMHVKCKCGHAWVAAWLPMEMGKCAKLLTKICCPMCGGDSRGIFLPTGPKNTLTMTIEAGGVESQMTVSEPPRADNETQEAK